MKTRARGGLVAMAVALALVGCAPAGKMTHDMDARIQSASTKADHEALAAHYEQEAKALQGTAMEHQKLADTYRRTTNYGKVSTAELARHCEQLAAKYQEAAKANLDLAKEHRALAADAR